MGDTVIVVSGIAEQWLLPLLTSTGLPGMKLNISALRALRFLRLLRVLRVLKLVRVFVQGDFAWVQGTTYEIVGTIILAVNSATMAIELDNPDWPYWSALNSVFLAYYSFDIACRLKYQGCTFFYARDTLGWNYLDFVIAMEGIFDLWLTPLYAMVVAPSGSKEGGSSLGILKILRL